MQRASWADREQRGAIGIRCFSYRGVSPSPRFRSLTRSLVTAPSKTMPRSNFSVSRPSPSEG